MDPTSSLARSFFDAIRNAPDSVAFLRALTTSPIPTDELDWRDFKADPGTDADRKSLWSKALSGFATNQGGVLVWGLDARKLNEVDRVCAETPVDDPFAFKTRLVELHRDAIDPPLPNVEYAVYPLPEDKGKGFVICFIPEGTHKPYRAMYCKNKPFYMRSGDSFILPSTSQLRSLFYPRTEAVFEVTARVGYEIQVKADGSPHTAMFKCAVQVYNAGNSTAKDIHVVVESSVDKQQRLEYKPDQNWLRCSTRKGAAAFRTDRPLHPGMEMVPFTLVWHTPTTVAHLTAGNRDVPLGEDVRLDFTINAEGQQPQAATFRFDLDNLSALKGCPQELTVKATPVS